MGKGMKTDLQIEDVRVFETFFESIAFALL